MTVEIEPRQEFNDRTMGLWTDVGRFFVEVQARNDVRFDHLEGDVAELKTDVAELKPTWPNSKPTWPNSKPTWSASPDV